MPHAGAQVLAQCSMENLAAWICLANRSEKKKGNILN
jgi:hypothetical protein